MKCKKRKKTAYNTYFYKKGSTKLGFYNKQIHHVFPMCLYPNGFNKNVSDHKVKSYTEQSCVE